MLVTTVYDPSPEIVEQSRKLADQLQCHWAARRSNSLPRLRSIYHDEQILIMTTKGLHYYNNGDIPLFFHPSTAAVRMKRLLQGESDLLLDIAGVILGDSILDCTA